MGAVTNAFTGGKGGEGQTPAYSGELDMGNQAGQMESYAQMMMGMMEQQNAIMQQVMAQSQNNMQLPPVFESPEIDWTEQNENLRNQAAGTFSAEIARKKGMEDTIFSSVLDEDEVATTSVLE